ncbi:MAG: hypothetical protein PVJ39_15065 [Gammaproteobacteria bacterium]|jgi:hypothetical protein
MLKELTIHSVKFGLLRKFATIIFGFLLAGMSVAHAGEVQIVDAKAEKQRGGWVFHVTLKHADSGWDHYADAWRVVTKDGKELGTRTLYHPHVNEQPFTRSLGDVKIPANVSVVYIEAHDKVHGWSKQRFKMKIR